MGGSQDQGPSKDFERRAPFFPSFGGCDSEKGHIALRDS